MQLRPHPHKYLKPSLRLGHGRRRALYLLVAVLFVTGALWLYVHTTRSDDAMPSSLEPWTMKFHGAAAMAILYLTGTMLYSHMLHGWQSRRNRFAGGVTAAVFGVLAVTGYGLYYFDGDTLRRVTEWAHWIVGFGAPLLLGWHIATGRRHRRKPIPPQHRIHPSPRR